MRKEVSVTTMKRLLSCMTLAAFVALVLSAVTLGSPVLTENGVAVTVGQKFMATQLGTSKITSTEGTSTVLECNRSKITGKVAKNSGMQFEGEIFSVLFGGTGGQAASEPEPECTGELPAWNLSYTWLVSEKSPWCLRTINAPEKDEFTIAGGKCGGITSNLKLITVATSAGSCEFESTGPLVGTYTTNGTSVVLKLVSVPHGSGSKENGFKQIAGSIFCPTSFSYDIEFTLETDEVIAKPLVIS